MYLGSSINGLPVFYADFRADNLSEEINFRRVLLVSLDDFVNSGVFAGFCVNDFDGEDISNRDDGDAV